MFPVSQLFLSCLQLQTVLLPKWHFLLTCPIFLLQMRKLSPQGSTCRSPRSCGQGASLGLSPHPHHWLSTSFVDPMQISTQGIQTLPLPPQLGSTETWASNLPLLPFTSHGCVSQSSNSAEPHLGTLSPTQEGGHADAMHTRCVWRTPPCCA